MGKAARKAENKRLEEQSRAAMEMAKEQFNTVKDYSNELRGNQDERLGFTQQVRDRASQFMSDAAAGKDITTLLPQEYGLLKSTSDNNRRAVEQGRTVGSRALSGDADANLLAQIDATLAGETDENLANAMGTLYETELGNQRNLGLGAEGTVNADNYNILNALNGVAGQSQNMFGLANQAQSTYYQKPRAGMQLLGQVLGAGASFAGAFMGCVHGSMLIHTKRGRIPAREVTMNDLILTRFENGAWDFDEIEEIEIHETDCLQSLSTEEGSLLTSESHCYAKDEDDEDGLTAREIKRGQYVGTYGGFKSKVLANDQIYLSQEVEVFNFKLKHGKLYVANGLISLS